MQVRKNKRKNYDEEKDTNFRVTKYLRGADDQIVTAFRPIYMVKSENQEFHG